MQTQVLLAASGILSWTITPTNKHDNIITSDSFVIPDGVLPSNYTPTIPATVMTLNTQVAIKAQAFGTISVLSLPLSTSTRFTATLNGVAQDAVTDDYYHFANVSSMTTPATFVLTDTLGSAIYSVSVAINLYQLEANNMYVEDFDLNTVVNFNTSNGAGMTGELF